MPGRDRTGPQGFGPMTGRGRGYCAGYQASEFGMRHRNRFGGRGRGYGWQQWYHATGLPGSRPPAAIPTAPQQELDGLKDHAEWLKAQLEQISQRIEELEKY